MKSQIIFFSILSMLCLSLSAQKGKVEPTIGNPKIALMKQKKALIVMVQSEFESHNNILKEIVPSLWLYHKDILFKTEKEIKELQKDGSNDYAILYIYYKKQVVGPTGAAAVESGFVGGTEYSFTANPLAPLMDLKTASEVGREAIVAISNIEDMNFKEIAKIPNIFEYNLHYLKLVDYDLISALNFITWYIEEATKTPNKKYLELYTENADKLKNLTLTLPKSYLEKPFGGKRDFTIQPDQIDSLYPYEFVFVEDSTFINIIEQKRAGYAYLFLTIQVTNNANTYVGPVIMEAQTGKVILVSRPIDDKFNKQYYYFIKNHFESILYFVNNAK